MPIEDSSTLQVAFKNSLILDKGSGDPSFVRATDATVFDNEGKLINVPSGVARFGGARLVVNQIKETEDLTQSIWVKIRSSMSNTEFITGPAVLGSKQVPKHVEDTTLANNHYVRQSATFVIGRKYRTQFYAAPGERKRIVYSIFGMAGAEVVIDLQNKTIPLTNFNVDFASIQDAGGIWSLITAEHTIISGSGIIINLDNGSTTMYDGDGVSGAYYTGFSFIDITGETNSNINDYVSHGELLSPWHGAGVDGVKWFDIDKSGTPIPDASLKKFLKEPAATNQVLYCRDGTNAVWVKNGITATRDQGGIDNVANTATRLTATAPNGTCLQTITLAAATRSTSFFVKRVTGTGTIEITRDGTNWTDITSQINSGTYSRVGIKGTSVTNPTIGFRITTSGDEITFDFAQDEDGSIFTSPIFTEGTVVTRNADQLTYQTSGNILDSQGAISAKVERDDWTDASGTIGDGSTTGMGLSSANSGVVALDGTNTVNGPFGTPNGKVEMAIGWSGSTLKAAANGTLGTPGTYDGSLNLTNIVVGANGNISDLNVWTTALLDEQLIEAAGGPQTIFLGQAVEINAAQQFSGKKIFHMIGTQESNLSQILMPSHLVTINNINEIDQPQIITPRNILLINLISESDQSQIITPSNTLLILQASESEQASVFSVSGGLLFLFNSGSIALGISKYFLNSDVAVKLGPFSDFVESDVKSFTITLTHIADDSISITKQALENNNIHFLQLAPGEISVAGTYKLKVTLLDTRNKTTILTATPETIEFIDA